MKHLPFSTFPIYLALLLLTVGCSEKNNNPSLKNSVVEIEITYQNWNEYEPWKKNNPNTRTAMGVILDKSRILTCADNLYDATTIRIKKLGQPKHYAAKILHQDPQLNLALLTVDKTDFFQDLTPVTLAPKAINQGVAKTIRWNESAFEIAQCHYVRAEVEESNMANFYALEILMKTDMDGGGWSEPVFYKNSLIGLTTNQNDDNQASILPIEHINAYLTALNKSTYPGFATLGIRYQNNQDKALSSHLGQENNSQGIIIRECYQGASAHGHLQPYDILLKLNGNAIDTSGNYIHPHYGRLNFRYIAVDGLDASNTLEAEILRNGQLKKLPIPLKTFSTEQALIPWDRTQPAPYYFIAGGLVFQELRAPFLRAWGNKWKSRIPQRLRLYQDIDRLNQSETQKKLIILSDVLPSNFNLGYHDLAYLVIDIINNQPIDSLTDVQEAFKQPINSFHQITFTPNAQRADIILDANSIEPATQQILRRYNIPQAFRLPEEKTN